MYYVWMRIGWKRDKSDVHGGNNKVSIYVRISWLMLTLGKCVVCEEQFSVRVYSV